MKTAFPKSLKTGEKFCFKTMESAVYGTDGLTTVDHFSEVKKNIANNATNIAKEKARIDNLVVLNEAGEAYNAELADMRVGYDGITYASAGSAVNAQFLNVFNAIKELTKYSRTSAPDSVNMYDAINISDDKKELYTNYVTFDTITSVSVPSDYRLNVTMYTYDSASQTYTKVSNPLGDSGWVNEYVIPRNTHLIIRLKHSDGSDITLTEIVALVFASEYPEYMKNPILLDAGFYDSLQYQQKDGDGNDVLATTVISTNIVRFNKPIVLKTTGGYSCNIFRYIDNGDGTYASSHIYGWSDEQFVPADMPCVVVFKNNTDALVSFDDFINHFTVEEIHSTNEFLDTVYNTVKYIYVHKDPNGQYSYLNSMNTLLTDVVTCTDTVTLYVNDPASSISIAYYIIENDSITYDTGLAKMITIPANIPVRIVFSDSNDIIDYKRLNDVSIKSTASITPNEFVKDIALCGLSKFAPLNTMPAFIQAKLQGFKYISADVHFTADGYPVISEYDISENSNGTGEVVNMTLEQLRQYDYGSWFSDAYAGTTIPTYQDFMSFCKRNGIHAYVVISDGTDEQFTSLINITKWYGMSANVTWVSFGIEALRSMKRLDPKSRLALATQVIAEDRIAYINELRTDYSGEVILYSSEYTDDGVRMCALADIPLEIWAVNDTSEIDNIPDYASGVSSTWLQVGKLRMQSI